LISFSIRNKLFRLTPKMGDCWHAERQGLCSKASITHCTFSGVCTVRGAPCFTSNTLPVSSNFRTQANMVFRDSTRPCRPTLKCRYATILSQTSFRNNGGNTMLHAPLRPIVTDYMKWRPSSTHLPIAYNETLSYPRHIQI
jgi:hypothetical protein